MAATVVDLRCLSDRLRAGENVAFARVARFGQSPDGDGGDVALVDQ
jgi:hypothetical protein